MNWYKWSQSDSAECAISKEDFDFYAYIVASYLKRDVFEESLKAIEKNRGSNLRQLIETGYAPLAFSRCISEYYPIMDSSILPFQAAEEILNGEKALEIISGSSNINTQSVMSEAKKNIARWYMESFLPDALIKNTHYRPSAVFDTMSKFMSSDHINSEMIRNFWELERPNRDAVLGVKELALRKKVYMNNIYSLFLMNRNTPTDIQVEIAKLSRFNENSLLAIIKNPNGSGEAVNVMLKDNKGKRMLSYSTVKLRVLFNNIIEDDSKNISDSVAEVLSSYILTQWDTLSTQTAVFGEDRSGQLIEYFFGLAQKTKSKKAMKNLFSFATKVLGLEETEHGMQKTNESDYFSALSPASKTRHQVRVLSPFIVNNKNIDNGLLQKILAYIHGIENRPQVSGQFTYGFDMFELIWSAYESYAGDFLTDLVKKKLDKSYINIIDAIKGMDWDNFQAHATSIGMPKLKLYKERMGFIRTRMGKKYPN